MPIPTDADRRQKGTDLGYIKQLANDERLRLLPRPRARLPGTSMAYWGPEIRIGIPQPALTIDMDAATNVESLSSASTDCARADPSILIQEPITKLSDPDPVPDISLLQPAAGARAGAGAEDPSRSPDTAKHDPIQALRRSAWRRPRQSADAITGDRPARRAALRPGPAGPRAGRRARRRASPTTASTTSRASPTTSSAASTSRASRSPATA